MFGRVWPPRASPRGDGDSQRTKRSVTSTYHISQSTKVTQHKQKMIIIDSSLLHSKTKKKPSLKQHFPLRTWLPFHWKSSDPRNHNSFSIVIHFSIIILQYLLKIQHQFLTINVSWERYSSYFLPVDIFCLLHLITEAKWTYVSHNCLITNVVVTCQQ